MYTASLKRSENYKAQPYQYASPSKQILKEKAKPFPPCTHYGFNDHRPDDCINHLECEIRRSYDHFTSGHNLVIHIRGGELAESSKSNESSIGVKCNTCGSTIYSTTDYNEFDHFKSGEKIQATKAREPNKNGCSRSMTGVKSYLHKYVEQPGLKQGTIFNANKEIVLIAPRRNGVYVLDMSSLTHNGACFFAKASETERKNRTLIEAARTMLNESVLSKHLWTEAVRITCYTQNRSIIIKRHDKTPYEIFRERIPDISYFHVFGCPMFIHNHKDHLDKFDANADDGYFLGYSFISKYFRVFNTRRQQVEKTYHVTFDESMEAIRFTNTSMDEIGIDDSSRYPFDEFIHEDDPSRQYQANSDISYYVIPHGRSLTKLTKKKHVLEVIAPNEPDIPHTEDAEGPPDLINTEGTCEQNIQDKQIITQPTEGSSENNTEVLVFISESLVPDIPRSVISNQAFTSSHPVPQNRWSKDQHIELMNIIGDP
ncbi:retrovirus-related pol polyprotein from transposon TNT 1-94, partial [Tanacetum coccineum]